MCDVSLSLNGYLSWLLLRNNDTTGSSVDESDESDESDDDNDERLIGGEHQQQPTTTKDNNNNDTVKMKDKRKKNVNAPSEIMTTEKYKEGTKGRLQSCLKSKCNTNNEGDNDDDDKKESRDNSNDYGGERRSTTTTTTSSNSCSISPNKQYYTGWRQQEQGLLSEKRKKSRENNVVVRFNNVVSIQFVDNITKYTEEERRASFYQEDEYAAIRQSLVKMVESIASGNYVGDDDVKYCMRGLEFKIPNTPSSKIHRYNRLTSQRAVINENARQKLEMLQRRHARLRQREKVMNSANSSSDSSMLYLLLHRNHHPGDNSVLINSRGRSMMTTFLTTKPNTSSRDSTNIIPIYDEEESKFIEMNAERIAKAYIDANKSCLHISIHLGAYDAMEAKKIHRSNITTTTTNNNKEEEESLAVAICRHLSNNKNRKNNHHSDTTTTTTNNNNNDKSIQQQQRLEKVSKHFSTDTNADNDANKNKDADDEHTTLFLREEEAPEIITTTTTTKKTKRRRQQQKLVNQMIHTWNCHRVSSSPLSSPSLSSSSGEKNTTTKKTKLSFNKPINIHL